MEVYDLGDRSFSQRSRLGGRADPDGRPRAPRYVLPPLEELGEPDGVGYAKTLVVPERRLLASPRLRQQLPPALVRYQGTFVATEGGSYEFSVRTQNGAILFVNGEPIVEHRVRVWDDERSSITFRDNVPWLSRQKLHLEPGLHRLELRMWHVPFYVVNRHGRFGHDLTPYYELGLAVEVRTPSGRRTPYPPEP